jgi:hypothetical protein
MMALSFVAGAAEVGEPAPPFSLTTADGKTMALADLAAESYTSIFGLLGARHAVDRSRG